MYSIKMQILKTEEVAGYRENSGKLFTEECKAIVKIIILTFGAIAFCFTTPVFVLFAAPTIACDERVYDRGEVFEEKTKKIKACFTLKNTGDEIIKISEVKPGCGCTVVKYDPIIKSGKSSQIKSTVRIEGYSGPITKGIIVRSNAGNEPAIRLAIKATVRPIIDVSEKFLTFNAAIPDTPHTVFLSSKKADLKVKGVSLTINRIEGAPEKNVRRSLALKHRYSRIDTTRSDGIFVYKLRIFAPATMHPLSGVLAITTNHPKKKKITVRAYVRR